VLTPFSNEDCLVYLDLHEKPIETSFLRCLRAPSPRIMPSLSAAASGREIGSKTRRVGQIEGSETGIRCSLFPAWRNMTLPLAMGAINIQCHSTALFYYSACRSFPPSRPPDFCPGLSSLKTRPSVMKPSALICTIILMLVHYFFKT
jgi:hypothetical protein